MNFDERDLKKMFEELRIEDAGRVPSFRVAPHSRRLAPGRLVARRLVAAAAVCGLLATLAAVIALRPRRIAFSEADRAAVRSIAAWNPPTGFLLDTPGREILTTTPVIPDVDRALESAKGASR